MKKEIDIDEIYYILRKYDIDQDILREILYKLYDTIDSRVPTSFV
jgi:hypothetical protein